MDRIIQASQNKEGEAPTATSTDLTELSSYEIKRLSNIAKIKARLRKIGLESSRGTSSRLSSQRKCKYSAVYIYIYSYAASYGLGQTKHQAEEGARIYIYIFILRPEG